MIINKKKFLFFLTLTLFLLAGNFVFALEVNYPTIFGLTITDSSTFPQYAKYFFNLGIYLSVILAVLVLVIGGFLYLMSGVAPKFRGPAKEWIKSGILGLILILASYVIINVINPNLLVFKLGNLSPFGPIGGGGPLTPPTATATYEEIPIGTLTENLLARAMNCHEFNEKGDPIDANLLTNDITEPIFLNHDRIDCFTKLADAAERKTDIFTKLSDKITEIMEEKCRCGSATVPPPPISENFGKPCPEKEVEGCVNPSGSCVTGACKVESCWDPVAKRFSCTHPWNSGICPKEQCSSLTCDKYCLQGDQHPNYCKKKISGCYGPDGVSCSPTYCDQPPPPPPPPSPSNCQIEGSTAGWCPANTKTFSTKPTTCEGKITCDENKQCTGPKCSTCEAGAKEKIEEGPICLEGDYDSGKKTCIETIDGKKVEVGKVYQALNEFRTRFPLCSDVPRTTSYPYTRCINSDREFLDEIVEKDVCLRIQGGAPLPITTRNNFTRQDKENCTKQAGQVFRVIKTDVWKQLRLVDQLRYLKEKANSISVIDDLRALHTAEAKLSQCYLAKPYAELLKIQEATSEETTEFSKTKFPDSLTGGDVDISRYCKGFEWQDSSFFHNCRQEYPGINPVSYNCFKGTSESSTPALNSCFNYPAFKQCLVDKRDDCIKSCQVAHPSKEGPLYEECINKCNNNSTGFVRYSAQGEQLGGNVEIKESVDQCYSYLLEFKRCADKHPDEFFAFKNCAEDSFRCKYASDQHSGYPDVLKPPDNLGANYSSLYIYQNPELQRCPVCSEEIELPDGRKRACVDLYPQTSKGPSCSRCPNCPLILDSRGRTTGLEEGLLISSGQCNEFAYNDDPLTFYCQTSPPWWEDSKEKRDAPLGQEWTCSKKEEVPVGQTVDEAEEWAQELARRMKEVITKTKSTIDYLLKIGRQKRGFDFSFKEGLCKEWTKDGIKEVLCKGVNGGYGECDSLCNDDDPPPISPPIIERTCEAKCQPGDPVEIPILDENGSQIGTEWQCSCTRKPCEGNPYQRIISFLRGGECSKSISYRGIPPYHDDLKDALNELKDFAIEPRSDILKKLIYSRKKMDEGSTVFFGQKEDFAKLLSCQRVKDEIIPPIADQNVIIKQRSLERNCYGKEAGEILGVGQLADNWFFCEKVIKN